MSYEIVPHPDGYALVEMRPETIGVFYDERIAQQFLDWLNRDVTRQHDAAADAPPKADTGPAVRGKSDHMTDLKQGGDGYSGQTRPIERAARDAAHSDKFSQEEFEAIVPRIEAGEKLKDLGEEFGKNWLQLRSMWARYKKSQNQKPTGDVQLPAVADQRQTPHDKVRKAIDDVASMHECTACGRSFTPTNDNLDHCARCAREVG